jgi:K+-sensing histidine kinase KdpD
MAMSLYRASLLVLAVASFVAIGCLAFFFAPQIFSFRVSDPTEAAAILAFLGAPVVPAEIEAFGSAAPLVESHGGRLWAAENSPRGASFYLTLPTKLEAHE